MYFPLICYFFIYLDFKENDRYIICENTQAFFLKKWKHLLNFCKFLYIFTFEKVLLAFRESLSMPVQISWTQQIRVKNSSYKNNINTEQKVKVSHNWIVNIQMYLSSWVSFRDFQLVYFHVSDLKKTTTLKTKKWPVHTFNLSYNYTCTCFSFCRCTKLFGKAIVHIRFI